MPKFQKYCWLITIVLVVICLLPTACTSTKTEIEPSKPPPTTVAVKTATPVRSITPSLSPTAHPSSTETDSPVASVSPTAEPGPSKTSAATPVPTTTKPVPTTTTPVPTTTTPLPTTTTPAPTTTTPAPTTTTPAPTTTRPSGGGGGGGGGGGSGTTDKTPPEVKSVTPVEDAAGVALGTSITVVFSETLKETTVKAAGSFTLEQDDSTPVPGSVTYASSTKTAVFKPNASLLPGATYVATLTTAIQDAKGNALAEEYSWSFTTTTLPSVVSVSPPDAEEDVAVNTAIKAVFSKAMDSATITAASFLLKKGTAAVTGQVTFLSNNKTATFTPGSSLAYNTEYTATLSTAIKDTDGVALEASYSWSFKTVVQPGVESITPQDDADGIPINTSISAIFTKAMNSATFTNSSFKLKKGNTSIPGDVVYISENKAATFTPDSYLSTSTRYTATLTTAIKDTNGVSLASEFSWSFTTGESATSVSISPSTTSVSTDSTFALEFKITNVTNLTAYQFRLKFDTSLVQLDTSEYDANFGVEDTGTVNSVDFNITAYPISGHENILVIIASLDVPRDGPADGDGYLAKVHFKSLNKTGAGQFEFSDNKLFDPSTLEIASNWQTGSVTVSAP
jgi:hypothetical protein